MDADKIVDAIFALSSQVRYVAVANGQDVELRQRAGLSGASSSASDRFEELLVNPALVVLTQQRGNIDCGGMRYVVIRYGNFFQVIVPRDAGCRASPIPSDRTGDRSDGTMCVRVVACSESP